MSYGRNDDENKLFVGGLSWETTSDQLREYFEAFGEVIQADVVTDQETGRSRGFGFVKFTSEDSIRQVESSHDHKIDGRSIDPKKARPRGDRSGGGRGGVSAVFLLRLEFW